MNNDCNKTLHSRVNLSTWKLSATVRLHVLAAGRSPRDNIVFKVERLNAADVDARQLEGGSQ